MIEVLEGQPGDEPLTEYSADPAARRIHSPAPVAATRRRRPVLALAGAVLAVVAAVVVLGPSPAADPAPGATPPPPAPAATSSPPTTRDPFANWPAGAFPDGRDSLLPASCMRLLTDAQG